MFLKRWSGGFGKEKDVGRGFPSENAAFVLKVEAVSGEESGNGRLLLPEIFTVAGVSTEVEIATGNPAEGEGGSELVEASTIVGKASKFTMVGLASGI